MHKFPNILLNDYSISEEIKKETIKKNKFLKLNENEAYDLKNYDTQ